MESAKIKMIGERIKDLRLAKGLTQEELAAHIGISEKHMSVIERGEKTPNLDTFISIANEFGVSADSILENVILNASGAAAELTELLARVPLEERNKIMRVVRILIEQ